MDERRIQTLEDVEQFLVGTTDTSLKLPGSKDDVYKWIERTLVRFRYLWLRQEAERSGAALGTGFCVRGRLRFRYYGICE